MSYADGIDEGTDAPTKERAGHPVIAMIVCFVLAVGSAANPNFHSGGSVAYNLGYVIGGPLLMATLAWAITIRHSTRGWQIGSLTAIFIFFAISGLSQIGNARRTEAEDIRAVAAQMDRIAQTGEISRIDEGSSPLGKMGAAMANGYLADQQKLSAKANAAGLNSLITFDGLTHDSAVLQSCASLSGIAEDSHKIGVRFPQHVAAGRAVGAQNGLSEEQLDAFVQGASANHPSIQRQWDLNAEIVRHAQSICYVLSKGKWRRNGSQIDLFDRAELKEVNGHLERVTALQLELQKAAQKAARDSAKSIGETF